VKDSIEVFQDLKISGPPEKKAALRADFLKAEASNWSLNEDRSKQILKSSLTGGDVLLFETMPTDKFPAAGLTLWETDDGYYVPNIVPKESGRLSYSQYNAILEDFFEQIAKAVAIKNGFEAWVSSSQETIDDWLPEKVATNLRSFSLAANKSTGIAHPSDEKRWLMFVVAAHSLTQKLDTDKIGRWLHCLAPNFCTSDFRFLY